MGCRNFDYFQLYLRALGLSFAATNKYVRAMLIAYGCAIVLSQLHQMWNFHYEELSSNVSIAIRVYSVSLFYAYKIVHVLLVVGAVLHIKWEFKLSAMFAAIDDDLQLRLYQPPQTPQHSRLSRLLSLRSVNILVELIWNLAAAVFFVCFDPANIFDFLRGMHTMHAIRVRYLQYSMLVAQIDDKLLALGRAIESNLIGADIRGNDAVFITSVRTEPGRVPQQQQQQGQRKLAFSFSDSDADSEEEGEAPVHAPADDRTETQQWHLVKRISVMKCVYWKITLIIRNMEQLFGMSIVLMDFLCICDFTIVCYVCTLVAEGIALDWSVLVRNLLAIVPAILKTVTLSLMCDRCSRKGRRILSLLNASKYNNRKSINLLLDDFTLQIMQNPVVFTARGFYTLNLKTLGSIFALVMQFLVILLQFSALTNDF